LSGVKHTLEAGPARHPPQTGIGMNWWPLKSRRLLLFLTPTEIFLK
jgi:hypothetical protein